MNNVTPVMQLTPEEARERLTPEFSAAMHKYINACELYGEESEKAKDLFLEAILIAPPAFMEDMEKMGEERGLSPKPDAYLEDGTPVVSLAALAQHLGIPLDEVKRNLQKLIAKRTKLGLAPGVLSTDPSKLFRKQ
jgi:hypothetical protein